MNHFLAFFNTRFERGSGWHPGMAPARRVARRVLQPFFFRLYDILMAMVHRMDVLEEIDGRLKRDIDLVKSHQWDKEAITRRLAALEDRIEVLTAALQGEPGCAPRALAIHAGEDEGASDANTRARAS